MARKSKAASQNGGGTAGGVTPHEDGKRSRRRKGRDRTPPGWAPPSISGEEAPPAPPSPTGNGSPITAPTVPVSARTAVLPAPDANFFTWIAERPFPSREASEQEAARELQTAAGESLDLLVASVPGAHSPDEAYARLESGLAEKAKLDDPDKVVPRHPLWSDDTIVYYHLRRHFGENATTQSMQRRRNAWYPIRSFGPLE